MRGHATKEPFNGAEKRAEIYDPAYVKGVFDRCGANYRGWSHIASFGFVALWRRQCIDALPPFPATRAEGYDLMAGTGETWPQLFSKRGDEIARLTAVDISSTMTKHALERLHAGKFGHVAVVEADVLAHDLAPGSADFVIATFGLKTFDAGQQKRLAQTIARVLRPGGVFSLIEASDPKGWVFRPLYLAYLKSVLPLIEKTVLRGAQDFSMLGSYVDNFSDCRAMEQFLTEAGLETRYQKRFFGCASGVTGRKPLPPVGAKAAA